MRKLQLAFSQKEKAGRLLASLETLKQEGSVSVTEYENMRAQYAKALEDANLQIAAIKEQIRKDLEARQRDESIYSQELKNLEIRFKVGEFPAERYRKEEQRVRTRLEKIKQQIADLQRLYNAQTAAELGGFVDVAIATGSRQASVRTSPAGLSLGDIFRESLEIYKSNPIIIVPSLLPLIWAIIASVIGLGSLMALSSPQAFGSGLLAFFLGFAISILVFFILFILAGAMTVEMVKDAYQGGYASLGSAFDAAINKIGPLLIAGILVGISLAIGYIVFVIPGLILTFLLWFVVQAIMLDDEGGIGSLRRSFEFFINNAMDAFIIVLASFGLLIVLELLTLIPVIGWILMLVGMPYLIALPTVLYMDRS